MSSVDALIAKIILFVSILTSIIFGVLMGALTFWYPLSYFKAHDISSWIGMPATLILFMIGAYIGALPFSYISNQKKNKTGYFGNLQKIIDDGRK